LVEDTRFSNTPELDREECLTTVRDYLNELGVDDWSICREESGVLPMPYSADAMPDRSDNDKVLAGGYAGGWFHPATGYSFPMAVAFADTLSRVPLDQITDKTQAAIASLAQQHTLRTRYSRFLNRLLFCLVKPTTRYQIFRRFYKVLSPAAIARFYAHRFTPGDALRIVVGMPPRGLRPITFARSLWKCPSQSHSRPHQDSSFTPVHPSARSEAV
jgi:lycopene beta-cyclase